MTRIQVSILFVVAVALFAGTYADVDPTTAPPVDPTKKPITTKATTLAPITNATTPSTVTPSTITTSTTTTSTPKPTTTSTTTPKPTTTSTTVSPSTTKPPKPVTPATGTWSVNNTANNETCIVLQMAVQFEIPYVDTQNKSESSSIDIPVLAKSTGNCSDASQTITISWNSGDATATGNLTLYFEKDKSKYNLTHMVAYITPDNKNFPSFPDNKTIVLVHQKKEFKTSLKMSYKCDKAQTLNFTDTFHNITAYMHLSHLQFQAYHEAKGQAFSSAEDCEPFDTPDIVPIVVGCALITLIIVVVIAYLIGRRRSQARGYLSM